jgi:2-dehydro-3-deoxygluconokinase
MTELLTFGESMLRLSPPRGRRLTRTDRLDLHVGGAESNVAVAAARLGTDATWLSRLPRSDLGRRVAHAITAEGVDVVVDWTETGRVGTYFLERGGSPRGTTVVYDRNGTPIADATPEHLDVARLRRAEAFFTTGITPALSETLSDTTEALFQAAREAGVRTVLDVNYRAKLWSRADAARTLRALFPLVDVLVVSERDARSVLEIDGDPERIPARLHSRHGFETVVCTRGEAGALATTGDGTVEQSVYPTETVDRVGSGDAFVGGFLARRLGGHDLADALAHGAATAALKRTVEGDMALVSAEEVQRVVKEGSPEHIDR